MQTYYHSPSLLPKSAGILEEPVIGRISDHPGHKYAVTDYAKTGPPQGSEIIFKRQ